MSRKEKSRAHHRSPSTSSSSSSDSEGIFIDIKRKTHKKHSKGHDSSSSEIEYYSNDKSKNKERCRKKKECSEKEITKKNSSCSEKSKKKDCRSSSETEHKDKCSFEDVYRYYKYCLLNDVNLMVGGSNAYLDASNKLSEIIPLNFNIQLENLNLIRNIDYLYPGAPFCVRESGLYLLCFIINSEESAQFSFYKNGVELPLSRSGNNSGSGQLIIKSMMKLQLNDCVTIRNSESSAGAIESNTFVGGLQSGTPATFYMFKIGAYETCKLESWSEDCLSRRQKYLFKKLLEKMLCDKDLMLKGFNVHGTFHTKTAQTVLTEGDFAFDTQNNVSNLTWDPLYPTQVTIQEEGIYEFIFTCNTTQATQIALSVNGIPLDYNNQGTNKGASQLSNRGLVSLKKNDIVTVKNHTSANGSIVTSAHPGGKYQSVTTILSLIKIAPCVKPLLTECKLNRYHKKCYEKFRCYLLNQKCLQLSGSDNYCNILSDTRQKVLANQAFDFNYVALKENIITKPSSNSILFEEDGIYNVAFSTTTNEPQQVALFINGVPNMDTVFGRDSGGSRCSLNQIVKFNKGDVLGVRNYESSANVLTTAANAGGHLVGTNCTLSVYKLSNL